MRRHGFTLIECAAAVLAGGALLAMLQPVFEGTRRGARAQTSADNLRFWGVASAVYVNDYGGLLPSYSWEGGECYEVAGQASEICIPPDTPNSVLRQRNAIGWQETDLLRRLTGRIDNADEIRYNSNGFFALRRRTHLVMADHIGLGVSNLRAVDPQDRLQLLRMLDPLRFEDYGPYPESDGLPSFNDREYIQRWPYSSSYTVTTAAFSADVGSSGSGSTVGPTTGNSYQFTIGTLPLAGRALSDVAFPAQKVFIFEWHDRHSTDVGLWYAYPQAKPHKLMFDGSVQDRPTGEAGEGQNPNDPMNPVTFVQIYTPFSTDPPAVGNWTKRYPVWYRWTRGGLAGIDYTLGNWDPVEIPDERP